MFVHLNVIEPKDIKTIQIANKRFYITPEGNKYPSITTVLNAKDKPWLSNWRAVLGEEKANKETKRTADRGSAVHMMIEKYLNNDKWASYGHKPYHMIEFNSLRLILKQINNIYCQETPLYSDLLKIGGRVDCIAEFNGKISIIDFKTSTNDKNKNMIEDYFLQTTAYALMFEEMYDIQIDNITIIMSSEKGAVPLVFKEHTDPYIKPLLERINMYYMEQKKSEGENR